MSHRLSLPLLVKEMVEKAARKRTYVVRTGYAAALCSLFMVFAYEELYRYAGGNPFRWLGRGKSLFDALVVTQLFGIYIFVPVLVAGSFTIEKERRSLELLLLTDLKPWEIVLQKYFGGLLPIGTFILLSMPLLALAYSCGGLSPAYLVAGIYILVLASLQLGAFSLAISAYCRTTVGAFFGCYGAYVVIFFSALLLAEIFNVVDEDSLAFLFPSAYFFGRGTVSFPSIVGTSSPSLISIPILLLLARLLIRRRAFLPPRNLLVDTFGWIDRLFDRLGRRSTRRVRALPDDQPITWHEGVRGGLGNWRYVLRMWLTILVPIVLLLVAQVGHKAHNVDEMLMLQYFSLWALSLLVLPIHAVNCIASERRGSRLELLLTTPLTARDIVLQKYRTLRGGILVAGLSLLSVVAASVVLSPLYYNRDTAGLAADVTGMAAAVFVYLPSIGWLGLCIGMRVRSPVPAVVWVISVMLAWIILPLVFFIATDADLEWVLFFSPAAAPALAAVHELEYFADPPWFILGLNYAIYGSIGLWLRHWCLKNADSWMRE